MKKLISLFVTLVFSTMLLVAQSTNNPNQMKLSWNPSPDTTVTSHNIYYKPVTNSTYSFTNVVGRLNTNAIIVVIPGVVYEFYATARNDAGLESDSSNKIRGQNVMVNGFGKLTVVTIMDVVTNNFSQFQLINTLSNGVANISLPSITYNPTNTVGKDTLVFISPETFAGQIITNCVSLYRAVHNTPTITVP